MSDNNQYDSWWSMQTLRGDPMRRPNIVREAFEAGMAASPDTSRVDFLEEHRPDMPDWYVKFGSSSEADTVRDAIDGAMVANEELCFRCKESSACPVGGNRDDSFCEMCRRHPT